MMLTILLITACESGFTRETELEMAQAKGNVTIAVKSIEMIPFENTVRTRAAGDINELCTRLQFAIFKDGERVSVVNQQSGNEDFGQVNLTLEEGTYDLVVLGHSGTGNATITDLDKIKFTDNKVTDTFYYYGSLVVDGSSQTESINLSRSVAMFRVTLPEALSEDVARLKIYYTGGSSTFSAITGFGSVESKQTEYKDVNSNLLTYEVYTFPHEANDSLKITVTALNADGEEIAERVFENVPVEVNKITQFSGVLFPVEEDGGDDEPQTDDPIVISPSQTIKVTGNGEWAGTITLE